MEIVFMISVNNFNFLKDVGLMVAGSAVVGGACHLASNLWNTYCSPNMEISGKKKLIIELVSIVGVIYFLKNKALEVSKKDILIKNLKGLVQTNTEFGDLSAAKRCHQAVDKLLKKQ